MRRIANLRTWHALFWSPETGSELGAMLLPMTRKGISREACPMKGNAAVPPPLLWEGLSLEMEFYFIHSFILFILFFVVLFFSLSID